MLKKQIFGVLYFLFVLLGVSYFVIFGLGYESSAVGIFDPAEVMYHHENLLSYLHWTDSLDNSDDFFSEREVLHMHDVRQLFLYGFILLFVSLGCLVYFYFVTKRKTFFLYLHNSALYSFGFLVAFCFFVFFGFETLFVLFHKIFFRNDLWLLPADSSLIQMYSSDFFYLVTFYILIWSIFVFLFTWFLSWYYSRRCLKS